MTYPQAIDFLYTLRLFGTKLGLENTLRLAELFSNPQEKLRFIHIAGTNGKGSTCAILESIYRSAGLKTGLFTSPHLVSFTERIQVDRKCIPESDVARLTAGILDRLGGSAPDEWEFKPTFFEFATVMAMVYFLEQKCELVIWETGMGGRLDATNIVNPLASVITNIQHDHQQWLGNSLGEIAAEKAGIIKPGVPVITGADASEALEVIRSIATERNAPLTIVGPGDKTAALEHLALPGEYQKRNAAVALATVENLKDRIRVSRECIRRGLETVSWPGRLQLVRLASGTRVLLDGAHNPDGAGALAGALKARFSREEMSLVLGLYKDKAWRAMCDLLVPLFRTIFLVPLDSERSADPEVVRGYCESLASDLQVLACETLEAGLKRALVHPFVVIAGSLHLVGEAMEVLGLPTNARSERSLNEWNASREA